MSNDQKNKTPELENTAQKANMLMAEIQKIIFEKVEDGCKLKTGAFESLVGMLRHILILADDSVGLENIYKPPGGYMLLKQLKKTVDEIKVYIEGIEL